ncbi:MAG TPA: hypothetical protein VGR47_21490 [Terracidiphilus sp.]|nr:hypothetical protein [Terracidiphilus sp.]
MFPADFALNLKRRSMRSLGMPVLLMTAALAQTPEKMITFNSADTEHCRVISAHGKPLLQSTYNGITVAVAMPVNRGNGEFLIFVAISQTGARAVEEDPKEFYGLYPDSAHTRFIFFDEAAQSAWHAGGPGGDSDSFDANSQMNPGLIRPVQPAGRTSRSARGSGAAPPDDARTAESPPAPGAPGAGPATAAVYLRRSKVKPGRTIAGWVALRQVKGANLQVHPADMLGEVDIPVAGIVFRF